MIVVALIAAYQSGDRIAATVRSAAAIAGVTRVLVVDDASLDDTAEQARSAGAEVLCLPANRGKGGAVAAGVEASPDADVFLLLDADLQDTASATAALLPPLLDDEADMAIAVLPGAGGRGGFGVVRDLSSTGIRRACGYETRAPLSGQRAVRADVLRQLTDAERFGLEVAMTIDAVRSGARILEIDAEIEHRHMGRSWRGFVHRGRQGADIARALWPRLTSRRQRYVGLALVTLLVLVAMGVSSTRWQPTTEPLAATPDRVVVFGFAPHDFDDVGSAETPTLDRIRRDGAVGAMTIRTVSRRPSISEGYLTLGAGARLRVVTGASLALPVDAELEGGRVGDLVEAATGIAPIGEIAVIGAPATIRANQGVEVVSPPGALADALADVGIVTGIVGVADRPQTGSSTPSIDRPAALAMMSGALTVGVGSVDAETLLVEDPEAPFGVRSDPEAILSALDDALAEAGVVVVDPGDLSRAETFRNTTVPEAAEAARARALADTDALLGRVIDAVGPDTVVYVVSVAPRGGAFRLTPVYAIGAGVPEGSWITSPSTKRTGLSTLTDMTPTIVHALTGENPAGFPGNPLRFEDGPVDIDSLVRMDRETNIRERTYYAQAQLFLLAQALLYAIIAVIVSRHRPSPVARRLARWFVLATASYPVATFVVKAIPWATAHGVAWPSVLALVVSALIATVASRRRGHPLAGYDVVLGLTVLVIVADAATGAHLNVSSWLGYSLHSAGRFYGLPNSTFAVLGSATILLAAIWVHRAGRRREALACVAALFTVVVVASGVPLLGSNVGSILTFVPVFGLMLWALSGRQIRLKTLVVVGLGTASVLAVAAFIDLMRPEDARAHLGRFADQVLDEGIGPIVETYLRKQAANFRIFRVSIWTWMIPIVVGFVLAQLVWGRGWSRLLPLGSAVRIGAVTVVSAALLGFAANDSGPIVIALFLVYLLPFLALLALDPSRDRRAVLHGPAPQTDGRTRLATSGAADGR
ncbi:MAG: glycosyltransferase family 2 protein [Acidimicrobiales bacterium]